MMDLISKIFVRILVMLGFFNAKWPAIKLVSFIPVHYRALRAYKPDIIICNDIPSLGLGHDVAAEIDAKLVFDSHELEQHRNPPLPFLQRKQVQYLEEKYLPKCDKVLTVCDSISKILRVEYGLGKVPVFYNAPKIGRSTDHPRWRHHGSTNLRFDAGLSNDQFALLYVGKVTVNRGIEFALDALFHLPESIVLVTVGPGSAEMKEELRAYARQVGVTDRFVILDPVSPSLVYKYARGADAAIIPIIPVTLSYEVALPNKFFETTLAGLPIISADLYELGRLISEYELGETYDALDVHDCVQAVKRVYSDPKRYRRSKKIQKEIADRFSWDAQEARYTDMIDEIVLND